MLCLQQHLFSQLEREKEGNEDTSEENEAQSDTKRCRCSRRILKYCKDMGGGRKGEKRKLFG